MKQKILVVMPAFNAARTLEKVYNQIPKDIVNSVLLVDDGSKDDTVVIAKRLGIPTIVHKKNRGYGENQKTCYEYALKEEVTHVIMFHPDGQYDGRELSLFVDALEKGKSDLVLGSRFLGKVHQTPLYKSLSIQLITFVYNIVLGTKLSEVNTGYRGFSRKFLETVPFQKNGNGYIFDPQIIIQAVCFGFAIEEVPVTKDYLKEASSPNLYQSLVHGLENMWLLSQYILHKSKIKKVNFLIN